MMNISYLLNVPSELTLREHSFSIGVGIALFAAFLLLAFARLARPGIYGSVAVAMLKTNGLIAFIKDSLPLGKRGSLLLIVNYLLSGSLVVYLWLGTKNIDFLEQLIYAVVLPAFLLFGTLGSMLITGWLTGEGDVLKEPRVMKVIGAQTIGVLYFLCALVWVLNISYQEIVIDIIFWTFIAESFLRVIKSVTTVYARGVSWYYIILYFCTLEILPLFIGYYYLVRNFAD